MVEKMSWDATKTIPLIIEYEKYELLYNPRHAEYRKKREREEALTKIANSLNATWHGDGLSVTCHVDDIKKKLNGLRSQYLFERAKINKSILQGDAEVYTPTIYWYPMLKFLEPVTANGPSRSPSFTDYVYSQMSINLVQEDTEEDTKKGIIHIDDDNDTSNCATASTSSYTSSHQDSAFNEVKTESGMRKRRYDYDPLFIPEPIITTTPINNAQPVVQVAQPAMMAMSKLVKRSKRLTLAEVREQLETFGKFVANELRGIYQSSDDVFLRQTKRQIQQVLIDAWTRIDVEDAQVCHPQQSKHVSMPVSSSSEDNIVYND